MSYGKAWRGITSVMLTLSGLVVLLGCGAKSGLGVPELDGGPIDARPVRDSRPMDTGPIDAGPPPVPDVCIELPPEEPPDFVDITFLARISTADVLLLVDVTGSMSDEIEQIRRTLRDIIIPEMARSVADVRFAVATHADFPVNPYGTALDDPFRLFVPSTDDLDAVQTAVTRIEPTSGGDGPESQIEALFQVATGQGRGRFIPTASCPEGTVGYPCFRNNGSRIILLFTDATFHNGPGGSNPYTPGTVRPTPANYTQTVAALRGIGAKVLGLYSGPPGATDAIADLESIARDTGAVTAGGVPIWLDIGSRGERLDTGVIESVRTLVEEVPIDIDTLVEDWPGDDLDALEFVTGVETLGADPVGGAVDLGDSYERVRPGTRVSFRVFLANDSIARGPEPISYFLTTTLRGDGVTRLKNTIVQVVIPSLTGGGCDVAIID